MASGPGLLSVVREQLGITSSRGTEAVRVLQRLRLVPDGHADCSTPPLVRAGTISGSKQRIIEAQLSSAAERPRRDPCTDSSAR